MGLALTGNLVAQAPVRLAQETPFLKDPGGVVLGTLTPGTRVVAGRTSGGHQEVTLRGWIFTASTRPDKREGFDLSLATDENLRAEPDGAILGRLVTGALVARVSRRGGWSEVRRTGWVQRALLAPPAAAVTAAAPSKPSADSQRAAPKPAAPAPSAAARRILLRAGATLARAPDGSGIGTLSSAAEASLEEQKGDWVKVRVDAWVKRTEVDGPLAPPPAITAAMLRENPERYVGQTVEWRVQFLAHQQADELRPEMPPGRPYLLARGPLPESGFVYVLLTKEQAGQLQGLQPLDELAVTATVRAARTRYLATPVVELLRVGQAK
jgi:hypothetical protein